MHILASPRVFHPTAHVFFSWVFDVSQVSGMEDKLRALHAKSLELETQLQVEARGRRFAEEANRELVTGAENARQNVRELQGKVLSGERWEWKERQKASFGKYISRRLT